MDDFFQIYCIDKPTINEFVLIKFTNRDESHIEGELVEYNLKAIMSYNDATKKKKIYSWNKIVPINKLMIAKVEEIFDDNIVQVSIAYNDKNIEMKDQLKPFNENKILLSIIKKICYYNKIDFNLFWVNIFYPLDKLRREEYNIGSFFSFFKNNISFVTDLIKEKYDIHENIIEALNNQLFNNAQKIISKFGLISMKGINNTLDVFKIITSNNDWVYNLKYDSAPYYILESISNTSTIKNHEEFIKMLESLCKDNKIFIKIEYIGKIIE
jgi:hypothetical protein